MGILTPSASTHVKSTKPKSILKRPTPLVVKPHPISPNVFPSSAGLSAYFTPKSPAVVLKRLKSAIITKRMAIPKSPHVHFPPSPILSMFGVAYSPATYDRAPISVSPSSLYMPPWGDGDSPTMDGFQLSTPIEISSNRETWSSETVPFVFVGPEDYYSSSPTTLGFEFGSLDPRSSEADILPLALSSINNDTYRQKPKHEPKFVPVSPLIASRSAPLPPSNHFRSSPSHTRTKQNSFRRRPTMKLTDLPHPNPLHPHSPTTSLSKSLTTYPRSPYPSAPVS